MFSTRTPNRRVLNSWAPNGAFEVRSKNLGIHSKNAPAAAGPTPLVGYSLGQLPRPRGPEAFYSAPAVVRGRTRQRPAPALTLAGWASAFEVRGCVLNAHPKPTRTQLLGAEWSI